MSISPSISRRYRCATALNAHLRPHPIGVLAAEIVPDSFRGALLGASSGITIYRIVNRRADLAHRRRPRLARAAAARYGGDACGRATVDRQARLYDVSRHRMSGEIAGEDARSARCGRATAMMSTSSPRRARSCTARCARWSARWCGSGDGRWSADDLAQRARGARPRGLRPGRAAGRTLSGAGGLLSLSASAEHSRHARTRNRASIFLTKDGLPGKPGNDLKHFCQNTTLFGTIASIASQNRSRRRGHSRSSLDARGRWRHR